MTRAQGVPVLVRGWSQELMGVSGHILGRLKGAGGAAAALSASPGGIWGILPRNVQFRGKGGRTPVFPTPSHGSIAAGQGQGGEGGIQRQILHADSDQRTRLPGPEPAGQGRPPVATTGEAGI